MHKIFLSRTRHDENLMTNERSSYSPPPSGKHFPAFLVFNLAQFTTATHVPWPLAKSISIGRWPGPEAACLNCIAGTDRRRRASGQLLRPLLQSLVKYRIRQCPVWANTNEEPLREAILMIDGRTCRLARRACVVSCSQHERARLARDLVIDV